jgi:Lon protease-like protein
MKPWDATELDFDAATFSGVVRLFPLPNLVLYPHVMQPLHIFEERYREMLEDALAGDQLIAMAVLEPGWEADYDSRPPVEQYACLGKVVAHHKLPDGRYNVLLLGVQRVRIVKELQPLRSFRQASVELIEDSYDFETSAERK